MIMTLEWLAVTHQARGCVGLRAYGLHTGVRGHVANMCPGS